MERATENARFAKIRDELAEITFEPWEHQPDEWTPPSNAEWAALANPHLINIRLAWVLMFKTKPEVMDVVRDLDNEAGTELMENMIGSIEYFKWLLTVLEGAEARILCAGSALEFGGGADE